MDRQCGCVDVKFYWVSSTHIFMSESLNNDSFQMRYINDDILYSNNAMLVNKYPQIIIISTYRRKIEEMPRLLRNTLFNTHNPMLHVRGISFDVGLVDHSYPGNDNDGDIGRILLFEEGVE